MANDSFRIRFERSGGLAGAGVTTSIDSNNLAEPDATQLRRLLDDADLDAKPALPRGADRFQYDITVDRGGQSRSITAYDGSMPAGVKDLSDWLLAYARRTKPSN